MNRMDNATVEALERKVKGVALTEIEINEFIKLLNSNGLHPAQIGAMLASMAIHGLSDDETFHLTKAMMNSGPKFSWEGIAVDKHSTGGVGDKISIALAPALAACGLTVPMLSGRGLEFTGGTLDKLESIPGLRVDLPEEAMRACIVNAGCFIVGASEKICPADKKLYEIRDVTGTVHCNGLITASILSKKLSGGAKYLIQDIKVGKAAFYKNVEDAEILASKMCAVAGKLGLKIVCALTRMDSPIGNCVGNSLEIVESLELLRGNGPKDLLDLTLFLGGNVMALCGKTSSCVEGEGMILEVLKNGSALAHFEKMIINQGVKEDIARKLCHEAPSTILPKAKRITEISAPKSGWIQSIDAMILAKVCRQHGAGRWAPGERLDLSVGVRILANVGSEIKGGAPWMEFHHNDYLSAEELTALEGSVIIADETISYTSRIIKVIM